MEAEINLTEPYQSFWTNRMESEHGLKSSLSGKLRELFLHRREQLILQAYDKVIVAHYGAFSMDFISELATNVENLMISIGDKRTVIKRMFTILIEGMQNVRKHGERDEKGRQLGYLLIAYNQQEYRLIVANLIATDQISGLEEYLNGINALSDEEMLAKYNQVLDREFFVTSHGSGLGMIITRLKTGRTIGISIDELSVTQSVCTFSVTLPRQ